MNFREKRKERKVQKKKEKTIKIINSIRNLFFIIFAIGGIGGILSGDYLPAILTILFGFLISSFFDDFIKKNNINLSKVLRIGLSIILFLGIGLTAPATPTPVDDKKQETITQKQETQEKTYKEVANKEDKTNKDTKDDKKETTSKDNKKHQEDKKENIFDGYTLIDASTCNLSGSRQPNVVVDIGYGDREYWAFTNEHGQLVRVIAKEIILQDDAEATNNGRYCKDEAKVPGTEDKDLDEGHVIADSLGGVSNAYNITPQNSTLNRHGDQAYMEKVIRQAGGCTDFEAIITYPNTETQIPSHYKYTYTLRGNVIVDEFDNENPEDTLPKENSTSSNGGTSTKPAPQPELTPQPPVTPAEPQQGMVWISETGSKYHTIPNCGRMNPNKASQVTVSEAQSMGLEPCQKCY